jgi:hypothetical protein
MSWRSGGAGRGCKLKILSSAALLVAVVTHSGCDSIDPTEQSFSITFRNDTPRKVSLRLCDDAACRKFLAPHSQLDPGSSGRAGISDRSALTRWRVRDSTSRKDLGCIPLRFRQKYENVVVRISQAVPCPGEKPLDVKKGKGLGRS